MSYTDAFWFWVMGVPGVVSLMLAGAGMYLLCAVRTRVANLEQQCTKIQESAAEVANLRAEQLQLQASLREFEATRADFVNRVSQAPGIDRNRQGQVMRLHRRGESIAGIASALRISAGEVALTLKVHGLNQKFLATEKQESSLVFSRTDR